MDKRKENFDSLVESIGQLIEMSNAANDQVAAELYRAMFRNDKDINKLDFNYADHILGNISMGCGNAVEDYKNYLQYLKTIVPEEYPSHQKMFDEEMKLKEEDKA